MLLQDGARANIAPEWSGSLSPLHHGANVIILDISLHYGAKWLTLQDGANGIGDG